MVGTDPEKFWNATRAKLNLSAGTLQDLVNESNPLAVLNVIEFVDDHVAEPIVRTRHDYFGHNHLDFNGPAGKAKYRTEINDLFKRYGLAYQLTVSAHLKLRKSGLSSTSLLV
ncbi:MAG TPA: hypothetical protein VI485_13620 [Vicinamibacterales bacterium]|nr:hypothetical protein [Vicinamibacterales bacterium]